MDLRSFLLGSKDFKPASQIIEVVRHSRVFTPIEVNTEEALLLFQTSKQQTWLVATIERLYCVLDDLNRGFTRVQWSIDKGSLIGEGKVTIPISIRETRTHSDRSGLIDIGKHRSWYFTKKLFASDPVNDQVERLIANRMLAQNKS